MRNIKKYLFFMNGGSSGPSFSPEYQAILDFATANGITKPSAGQQIKENTKLQAYKDNGLWTTKDVIYNFYSNGSKEFCTLNWKNPALFRGTLHGGITWASLSGFSGNGVDGYLDTGFDLTANGVNYSLNDASIILDVFAGSAEAIPIINMIGDTSFFTNALYLKYAPDGRNYLDLNNAVAQDFSAANPTLTGLYQCYRNGVNSLGTYKDGVSLSSGSTVSTGRPDACSVVLFAKNNNNVISGPYSALTVASLEIGSNLITKAAIQNTIQQTFMS